MNTAWTKGIKKGSDEYADIEAAFAASSLLRKRLIQILEEMYATETKARTASSDYESPAWAYKQADAIGYARAIASIIKLLPDDKKNS